MVGSLVAIGKYKVLHIWSFKAWPEPLVGLEMLLGYSAVGGVWPLAGSLLRDQEENLLREAAPWIIYSFLGAKGMSEGYKNN